MHIGVHTHPQKIGSRMYFHSYTQHKCKINAPAHTTYAVIMTEYALSLSLDLFSCFPIFIINRFWFD